MSKLANFLLSVVGVVGIIIVGIAEEMESRRKP